MIGKNVKSRIRKEGRVKRSFGVCFLLHRENDGIEDLAYFFNFFLNLTSISFAEYVIEDKKETMASNLQFRKHNPRANRFS